MMNILIFDPFA